MPTYRVALKSQWDDIARISEKIAGQFQGESRDTIDAIKMVCHELCENVVKYGLFVSTEQSPTLKVSKEDDGTVIISTTNKIKSPEDKKNVIEHLKEIHSIEDKSKVYINRLDEIKKERGKSGSRLGLYRIAFETNFKLGYQMDGDSLTIIAVKKFIKGSSIPKSKSDLPQLKADDLEIQVSYSGATVNMAWIGKSKMRNPIEILNPYFEQIITYLKGKELSCDFSTLEFMNSSTVPAIINFAQLLDENQIKTTFIYSKALEWQVNSFEAFSIIAQTMNNISCKGK
jgi:hypothetical protein